MFDETQQHSAPGAGNESVGTAVMWGTHPQPITMPEMAAAQAAATPKATALAAGPEEVSYADLDGRSNQLARYLYAAGVGPDQLVGLSMERSPSMVIAALAILKAGGAYVPLDSTLPIERLDFMLRDADFRVLLAEGAATAKLPKGSWRLVDFQKQADEIANFSCDALACSV